MNRKKRQICGAGAAWLLAGLFLCTASSAQGVKSRSAEELLEYTLQDLQASMRTLAENNGRQEARNDALRKRILFLREESRKIEDEKLKLLEEYMNISGEDDLDLKDHRIAQNKTQFILKREEWLKEEQASVQKRLRAQQTRQERLEEKVKNNEARLSRLKKEQREPQVSLARKKMQDQKTDVLEMIREREQSLSVARAKKALLDRDLDAASRSQDEANAKVVALREEAGAMRTELRRAQRAAKKLKDQAENIEQEKTRTVSRAQKEVLSLQEQRDQLARTLEEMKDSVSGIAGQAQRDQTGLKKIISELKDEARVLAEREEGLSESVAVHEDFLEMVKALPVEAREDAGTAALQEKKTEQENLREKLSGQNQRRMELIKEQAALEKELRGLEAQKTAARRRAEAGAEQTLQQREREMRSDVAQWRKTVERSEAQLQRRGKEEAGLQARLDALKVRRAELEQQKLAVQEAHQDLEDEMADLENGRRAAASDKGKSARQLEREIKDLQMRSTLLSGSLSVIQSRFDAKDLEVREFKGDEAQLREYLRVLGEENAGLIDKLTGLRVAAEKLTAQKKILESGETALPEASPSLMTSPELE